MRVAPPLLLCAAVGCSGAASTDVPVGLRAALERGGEARELNGLCDASAAAWLDAGHLVVADDEGNALRVYAGDNVDPTRLFALDAFLRVDAKHPEADIEATAASNGLHFWLTSHARNKNGEPRPSRRRFFAVRWNGAELETVGEPYERLLEDLSADARYAPFDLDEAARRAPKSPGGLNLEGLARWSDGVLLIGARNPRPGGLALVIPLQNAEAVVTEGATAVFGEPLRWDLDGRGVRALEPLGESGFLVAAGPASEGADRLYFWNGDRQDAPAFVGETSLNVEGLAYDAERARLLLVSDDGTRGVGGVECKRLDDVTRRKFRVREIAWPR